jgi:hypothetical protein
MQHAKLKGNSQRAPLSVPSDQNQRDREEVRPDNLDPSLVRFGGRENLPSARAGLGYAVVSERTPNRGFGLMRGELEGSFEQHA